MGMNGMDDYQAIYHKRIRCPSSITRPRRSLRYRSFWKKAIYSKEPTSYAEVIQVNKDINVYIQNINRIEKRNGKSILSADQIQLKEETLEEI